MPGKILSGRVMKDRNERVFDLWMQDFTQKEIGEQLGITQARVSQILNEWFDKNDVPETERTRLRKLRLAQIDQRISDAQQERDAAPTSALRAIWDRRLQSWYEYRSKVVGEYAQPSAGLDDTPMARYVLELPGDTQEALS